jgi:hypothetical protein
MDVVAKNNFTVDASIVVDDTRVSVEGENFTDVKWEMDDMIQLSSASGTSMTMTANAISEDGEKASFAGEGSVAAAEDTYYAIYPAVAITEGVATIDLAEQSGDDAAVLVAKTTATSTEGVSMSFTPANALLHVAVSGVETLAKAEFKAFDGSAIAQQFVYNFVEETTSTSGEVAAYTIANPANSFFFSLPADMDMTAGYIVSLTDAVGNVCTKAYNGKTFAKGTTTRVNIEWSTPSVALGTPMTSYSYYVSAYVDKANSCANNVIYFTTASTFAGVQNAMIAEAGYIVNGEYIAVATDASSKSISGNVTVSSWGEKSIQAYIKTKDGKEYKSSETATVHITGLPYTLNPAANDAINPWTPNNTGNVSWDESNSVRIGYNLSSWTASTSTDITKSFVLPANVNVVVNASLSSTGSGSKSWIIDSRVNTTCTISVSGNSIYTYTTTDGGTTQNHTCSNVTTVMTSADSTIKCHNSYSTATGCTNIKSLALTYGNK